MGPSGNQVRLLGPLRRSWSASLIITVLAASLTGAACGERTSVETQLRDMSSDAEADGAPASATAPDSPTERLAALASAVADGGFDCDTPRPSAVPDPPDQHAASMSCRRGELETREGDRTFSVYLHDPPITGDKPCYPVGGNPFDEEPTPEHRDHMHHNMRNDDFHVAFELSDKQRNPDPSSMNDAVQDTGDFAVAAGWDTDSLCFLPP